MCADPYAALERQRQREAAHRRRQESQREDLRFAARTLIPDHGCSVTLAQLAVQARLSRHTARGLYHSATDLAVDLVCHAWRALIEAAAPAPGMTPETFCACLIGALRADPAAHRVWGAIQCGLPPRHQQTLAEAEAFLWLAIGEALREICPALPAAGSKQLGGRILALARHAAHDPAAGPPEAEAPLLAAILPPLPAAAPAAPAEPATTAAASPPRAIRAEASGCPSRLPQPPAAAGGLPRPPAAAGGLPRPPAAAGVAGPAPAAWALPRPHGPDPPARAA
jgi:hypothetical protein